MTCCSQRTLTALVTKLLMFNEGCKESQSVKVSQNWAALFYLTFLMLVFMVQSYGSSVVLKDTSPRGGQDPGCEVAKRV